VNGEGLFYAKVAALAVALIVGFAAGRWLHGRPEPGSGAGGASERSSVNAAQPAAGGTASARESDSHDDDELQILRDNVGQLENELRMARAAKELYERELFGDPIAWPETIPEEFQPGVFQRAVQEAMEDCEAALVGFECEEPPCIALLRNDDPEFSGPFTERCPGWVEQFGDRSSGMHTHIDCGDGRSERVHMVSPSPYGTLIDDEDDEARTNYGKRRRLRYQQLENGWECETAH